MNVSNLWSTHAVRENWQGAAIAVAAGAFLALLGPFGSFAAPLAARFIFWIALLLAGSLCAVILKRATGARPRLGSNPMLRWAFLTLGVTAPMGFLSWALARILFEPIVSGDIAFFFGATFLISGAATAFMMILRAPGVETKASDAAAALLRTRLPMALRAGEILAVSAEDHYLRIHTTAGSALILLRLSDAIKELAGIEGAQVHRSWWVARAAISGSRRDGRNVVLNLKGDLSVPVSRPNARALKESGWI